MKSKQLKIGAILSYVSLFAGMVISIIYTPFMINTLGKSEFGLYSFVASLVAYLGLLNFGFSSAYVRYYTRYATAKDNESIKKLNGMFILIFTAISILVAITSFIILLNFNAVMGDKFTTEELELSRVLFSILSINLIINFMTIVFDVYIIANERFIFQKTVQLIKTITSPLISILLLSRGYGSIGLAVSTTTINIIISLLLCFYNFRKINFTFTFRGLNRILLIEMTIFSSYIFLNMIIDQINWNVDKYIIGRFLGAASVGVYTIAAQFNTYYITFSTAISSVYIPRVNQLVARDEGSEVTNLFVKIGRIQFVILSFFSVGFILLGKEFISIWAGKGFSEAYPTALLLMLPVTIALIQNIGIEVQKAMNLHRFRSMVYLFIAILNVLISIPLVQRMGIIGAPIGTAIGVLIGNGVLMNIYYKYKIGLDVSLFWKNIFRMLPGIIIALVLSILFKSYFKVNSLISIFVAGLVYSILYIIIVYNLSLNKYEKSLIKNLRKFRR